MPNLLPGPLSSLHTNHNHAVQFYENEKILNSSIKNFIDSGLRQGEGVIIIATNKNWQNVFQAFGSKKPVLASARKKGQLMVLDAHELLSKFLVGTMLDATLFNKLIGTLIQKVTASFPKVRAYGEMVNVLAGQNNFEAVNALEKLWNELIKRHSISLLCGYTFDHFKKENQNFAFNEICKAHSYITPSEKYGQFKSQEELHRYIAELQQKALALQAEITERKIAEKSLRESEKNLHEAKNTAERVNQAKSGFLANMSHEMRTPLVAILCSAELMLDNQQKQANKINCAETIIRNGKQLIRLLNDILDISKVESSHLQVEKIRFSLHEVIAEITSRLRLTLINLVGNAIKFTSNSNVTFVIRSFTSPDSPRTLKLEFTVKDTGVGLSSEQTKNLF